ncbi:ribbon-helix-helix protein, CopG family [Oligella sp. HMSC09E12]|uniref:type II toxin-antitoxin system RelB family antitoxin n=1 Tax=Oligella sp. HMSC09E12 TaxID=1581147 RepID=UPI0008A37CAF|nr:ribbon-helix-helix protein, CopG family [Oligella sp. HMSC09E12]OFV50251.1 CopG family transcriptional regulator [Oligella sp. HMSC09E12]
MNKSTNVSLRLPTELVERISHLAETTGRSRTYYMQEAIKQHIDDLEDLYLAEQALVDVRIGKSETISLETLIEEYGLED